MQALLEPQQQTSDPLQGSSGDAVGPQGVTGANHHDNDNDAAAASSSSPAPGGDVDTSPGQQDSGGGGGLKRLTAALTAVLSSGMASDFVEGLKPVLHNGKLAISTYIQLGQDPEPVFIGMFPSLPAAVAAQKQSSELVGVVLCWCGVLVGALLVHYKMRHCAVKRACLASS